MNCLNISVGRDDYFDHPHNSTITNERCIELTLAFRYLDMVGSSNTIEMGAVTPYYKKGNHICYDPKDPYANQSLSCGEIEALGKNVLSISTIEHVGMNEHGIDAKKQDAYDFILRTIDQASSCLISWPIGYQLSLDNFFKTNKSFFNYFYYVKHGNKHWELSFEDSALDLQYGKPFNNANAVVFIYAGFEVEQNLRPPSKINVGCGNDYREGWVNMDNSITCKTDLLHDIENLPWPMDSSSATEILMQHVFEHIDKSTFINVVREIYRVSKDGCIVRIISPHAGSNNYWTDPTHNMPLTSRTFDFFDRVKPLYENGVLYGWSDVDITVLSADVIPSQPNGPDINFMLRINK
jgi:hypothetical protein